MACLSQRVDVSRLNVASLLVLQVLYLVQLAACTVPVVSYDTEYSSTEYRLLHVPGSSGKSSYISPTVPVDTNEINFGFQSIRIPW